MLLGNQFSNTGEIGLEDVYNYSDWSYSVEYMEMAKAYNLQENSKCELKEAI